VVHSKSGRGTNVDGCRYTHDGWNRLVEVEFVDDIDGSPTASTVGEYAYNGLNWRIMRQADTDLDNDLDQQRMMYCLAAPGITPGIWQLLRRRTAQVQVQEIGDCPEFSKLGLRLRPNPVGRPRKKTKRRAARG
jgi:hypothetical protein